MCVGGNEYDVAVGGTLRCGPVDIYEKKTRGTFQNNSQNIHPWLRGNTLSC